MRLALGLTTIALGVSLLAPTGAAAATEFGDNCVATEPTNAPLTFFQISSPSSPLPQAAPTAGIITKWKTSLVPTAPPGVAQTLQVVRILSPGAPGSAQIVGQKSATLTNGPNVIDVRIPVQAGDRLGLYGPLPFGNIFCNAPGQPSTFGVFEGSGSPGATVPFFESPGVPIRIPVAAVIEPDADSDGFGDETQDGCPQSAAAQGPCPVTVVDTFPLTKKGKVVVLVATSATTTVTVTGSAKLPKAKKAGSSAQAKLAKVTRVVAAGTLTRFSLNFPGKLRSAIAALPKGRSIGLKLTARAANLTGPATTDRAQVKLKGTGAKRK